MFNKITNKKPNIFEKNHFIDFDGISRTELNF